MVLLGTLFRYDPLAVTPDIARFSQERAAFASSLLMSVLMLPWFIVITDKRTKELPRKANTFHWDLKACT
jgi:hypothetical protein